MTRSGPIAGVFYALALTLTALAAAEVTARVEDRVRQGVPLLASPSDRDLVVWDQYGLRGRPNGRYKIWRLNSAGFRNAETSVTPTPGCTRVVALGASETFGLYESDGREYPAQLSGLLKRKGCHEVINAAVAGMTVRTITALWGNWVSRFRPSVVVVYPTPAFYLANVSPADTRVPGPAPGVVPPPVERFALRIQERAVDRLQVPAPVQRWRVRRWLADARAGKEPSWAFESVPADRLRAYVDDVALLTCRIAESGARPIIVTHATAFHEPWLAAERDALDAWNVYTPRATADVLLAFERAAAEGLRAMVAARGVALVDAASRMSGRREWFAGDFVHFSDEGAGVMASLVADQVTALPPPAHGDAARACGLSDSSHALQ